MPKIAYKQINFRDRSLELIDKVNNIVREYDAQNYELYTPTALLSACGA